MKEKASKNLFLTGLLSITLLPPIKINSKIIKNMIVAIIGKTNVLAILRLSETFVSKILSVIPTLNPSL